MEDQNEFFSILDTVDSTNNYAMGQVQAGLAKHGQAWFAKEQTSGKGQRGKKWQTGKGENIALSIAVVPPGLKPAQLFMISMAVSLGCFDFFYALAGEGCFIKWPNDIYWGDRKAGGILIENILQGENWKHAIIGIGINVNRVNFDPELKNPVSLKQITQKDHEVIALAKQLHHAVMLRINDLNEKNFPVLLQEYNRHLYKLNSSVMLRKEDLKFETEITGVGSTGKLMTGNEKKIEYDFGEIEWLIAVDDK